MHIACAQTCPEAWADMSMTLDQTQIEEDRQSTKRRRRQTRACNVMYKQRWFVEDENEADAENACYTRARSCSVPICGAPLRSVRFQTRPRSKSRVPARRACTLRVFLLVRPHRTLVSPAGPRATVAACTRVRRTAGEADCVAQTMEVVGDPRTAGTTLWWSRGFRQAADPAADAQYTFKKFGTYSARRPGASASSAD